MFLLVILLGVLKPKLGLDLINPQSSYELPSEKCSTRWTHISPVIEMSTSLGAANLLEQNLNGPYIDELNYDLQKMAEN